MFHLRWRFIEMGNMYVNEHWIVVVTAENMKSVQEVVKYLIAITLQEGGSCIRRCKASSGHLPTSY
jgi:hypothetical protein